MLARPCRQTCGSSQKSNAQQHNCAQPQGASHGKSLQPMNLRTLSIDYGLCSESSWLVVLVWKRKLQWLCGTHISRTMPTTSGPNIVPIAKQACKNCMYGPTSAPHTLHYRPSSSMLGRVSVSSSSNSHGIWVASSIVARLFARQKQQGTAFAPLSALYIFYE